MSGVTGQGGLKVADSYAEQDYLVEGIHSEDNDGLQGEDNKLR